MTPPPATAVAADTPTPSPVTGRSFPARATFALDAIDRLWSRLHLLEAENARLRKLSTSDRTAVLLHLLLVAQVVGGGPALFHMAGPAVAYAYVALMLIPAAVSIQRAAFILWGIHDA